MLSPAELDRWIVRRPNRARPALTVVCLPYAGGGASIYRDWHGELGAGVEVWAAQLPGREGRLNEAPGTTMDELVEPLADLIELSLESPVAVFGHSMGAIIAFELARALEGRDLPPNLLVISGCRALTCEPPRPLHALPDAELIAALAARHGRVNEALEQPELAELLLPMLRADLTLVERHRLRPEPLLSCPVLALSGMQDELNPPSLMHGWRERTRGPFELVQLPGSHFFLVSEQPRVLSLVRDRLAGGCVHPYAT